MEKRFVSIKDLAVYLGVSEYTVKSWVYQDRLPCKRIGRVVRFDIKEINDMLKNGNRAMSRFIPIRNQVS